jgi:hypothetical protein
MRLPGLIATCGRFYMPSRPAEAVTASNMDETPTGLAHRFCSHDFLIRWRRCSFWSQTAVGRRHFKLRLGSGQQLPVSAFTAVIPDRVAREGCISFAIPRCEVPPLGGVQGADRWPAPTESASIHSRRLIFRANRYRFLDPL